MKKTIITALIALLLFPFTVLASEATYTSMNLEETLEEEGIDITYSNYEETDDQVTIYSFRGSSCSHCQEFLEFLESIVDEYGEYFKLVSFEVWYDTDNNSLLSEVAEYFDESSYGVPFIVIGDEYFVGYSSSYDDQIINTITSLYEEEDRFDILEELDKEITSTSDDSNNSNSTIVLVVLSISLLVILIGVLVYYNTRVKELNEEITELKKKVNKEVKNKKVIEK